MREHKKIFLFKGFLFILIFIILFLIINQIYYVVYLKNTQLYKTNEEFKKYIKNLPNKKINYIFLGASQTQQALNPRYINDSFNFAIPGENYIKQYYKLKNIIEHDHIKVNNIILELNLISLSSIFTDETRLFNNLWYYSKIANFNEISNIRKKDSVFSLLIEAKIPVIGRGEDIITYFFNNENVNRYNGWIENNRTFLKGNMSELAEESYKTYLLNQNRIDDINLFYLIRTLKFARDNKINIIFIKTPISKEYDLILKNHSIENDNYYNQIFKVIDHDLNYSYFILDYQYLFLNESYYFSDPNHLNSFGAEELSKKVNKDLNKVSLLNYLN